MLISEQQLALVQAELAAAQKLSWENAVALRLLYENSRSLRDLVNASGERILPGNLDSMNRVIDRMQRLIQSMFDDEQLGDL